MASIFENLSIKRSTGRPLPAELIALRREVFQKEVKYLNDATIEASFDDVGTHIMLIEKDSGRAIASAHVTPADIGELADMGALTQEQLRIGFNVTRVMVDPAYRKHGLMRVVIYLAIQQARIWGRTRLFCFIGAGDHAAQRATQCEFLPIAPHVVIGEDGTQHEFRVGTQDVGRMAAYVYDGMSPETKEFLAPHLAEEIGWTIEARLDDFFCNPWFVAIRNRTLTRLQYIESLANMHQFVRLTTRILGRAISLSNDSELRAHFAEHLTGEMDHEKMIENDLRYLGADVDYVRDRAIPNKATRRFMVIQESLLAFRQDPILFLAVPFCIEGFSANLNQTFLTDLAKCITSFGGSPKSMSFIRSHVMTDGGDDGHWAKNLHVIRHCVRDDKTLQEFLSLMHLTFDAIDDSYASYVREADPFSTPAHRTATIETDAPAYERSMRLMTVEASKLVDVEA